MSLFGAPFDLELARSLLDGGVDDESLIDRYGELIEAHEDARLELEVTTTDGEKIRLGGAGSRDGAGPQGLGASDGPAAGPADHDNAQPDPGADPGGQAAPGALQGLRGADPASPLDRARILSRSGRALVDHLLHDRDARRRLDELAQEVGYKAPRGDDRYALLSDLLQYASWAAAAHVARALEIEQAIQGRSHR